MVVSEIRGGNDLTPFSFAVQVLGPRGIPELEKLMEELTVFHQGSSDATPANFIPRANDLVSARFS